MANTSISSICFLRFLMGFLWVSSYCMKSGNANRQILQTNNTIFSSANNGHVPVYDDDDDGSLLPTRPCQRPIISPEENPWRGGASMLVMSRWCGVDRDSIPTEAQLMEAEAERVRSIQARLADKTAVHPEHSVGLIAYPGANFNSASYVVEVGLGTPPQIQHLVFDTGSTVTWVQCQSCNPCIRHSDKDFDPSTSTIIPCESSDCPHRNNCGHKKECKFTAAYSDETIVYGDFVKAKMTLSNKVVKNDYLFGCAKSYDKPKLGGTSGIMGLGNASESIINQASQKYGPYFSYCLPTRQADIGHLTFGPSNQLKSKEQERVPAKLIDNKASEYLVELDGIIVGTTALSIPKTVFRQGVLIDSGSPTTWLPQAAYAELREEFKKQMGFKYSKYLLKGVGPHGFDTCYDFTHYNEQISLPAIKLIFAGKVIELNEKGVMGRQGKVRCLMFKPNEKEDQVSIIGSNAQKTFDIIFDLENRQVQFGPNGCK